MIQSKQTIQEIISGVVAIDLVSVPTLLKSR